MMLSIYRKNQNRKVSREAIGKKTDKKHRKPTLFINACLVKASTCSLLQAGQVSGQSKTETAVQNFAKIHSVIDTTIKNGMNVLEVLILIAKSQVQTTNLNSINNLSSINIDLTVSKLQSIQDLIPR